MLLHYIHNLVDIPFTTALNIFQDKLVKQYNKHICTKTDAKAYLCLMYKLQKCDWLASHYRKKKTTTIAHKHLDKLSNLFNNKYLGIVIFFSFLHRLFDK